jgi:hypothetical protein
MLHRLSALVLALLTLLGALHEGVHLLEHAQHEGLEACLHAHEHSQQSSEATDTPLLADPHHAGHAHVCPVCFTPQTGCALGRLSESVLRLPLQLESRPEACTSRSWLGDALPPSRGPPLS